LFIDGQKVAVGTKMSQPPNSMDTGAGLISAMSKQLGLTKGEFLNLVDCPLEKEPYIQLLRDRQRI